MPEHPVKIISSTSCIVLEKMINDYIESLGDDDVFYEISYSTASACDHAGRIITNYSALIIVSEAEL